MNRLGQPIKWHGGKFYLAPKLIDLFPPHVHYVEPYFGGGAVLFAKPAEWVEGHSEVVNDLNGELMNFWRVLADEYHFPRFCRVIQAVPFGEAIWNHNREASPLSEVDCAVAFFVRYRQSRQGLGKDFATLSRTRTRRGMNEQASSWLSAIEGLPEAHERLKRVVILNGDAIKVIRQQDGPGTFFYLDPPYLHGTRVTTGDYEHEMTEDQHAELLITLGKIRGRFMLSGYRSSLYDASAESHDWRRMDFPIDCKASGAKEKPKRVESVWMNY